MRTRESPVLEEWLERVRGGKGEPGDYDDCQDEIDLEFHAEKCENIVSRLEESMKDIKTNEIEYLDGFQLFRPTQRVECVRLIGFRTTKVIFVFHTRHGAHFLYDDLEDLVQHFIEDTDPKYRFESEAELESFLMYWKI